MAFTRTFTWNTDDVYTYTGDTLDYYVTTGEIMVYEGRAVKSPSNNRIEINLRKIVEDWLEMEFRDFLPMDGELYHHEDAFRTFTLHRSSDDAVLFETNCVINDLGDRYPSSGINNDPVDGCADPRQKLFVTYFGNWTDDTEKDVDIDVVDPDQPPYVPPGDYSGEYLTVRFNEDASVYFHVRTEIEISVDGGEWTTVSGTNGTSAVFSFSAGQTVRFAEDLRVEEYNIYSEHDSWLMQTSASFDTWGNVNSIIYSHEFLNGKEGLGIIPGTQAENYALPGVFYGLNVRDASQLTMPSSLADVGFPEHDSWAPTYYLLKFFMNCTKLEKAPVLPAPKVPAYAYADMFRGCSSLTVAPEINATYVREGGFDCMFAECVNLRKGPSSLPANIGYRCCDEMFAMCTNLREPPLLPATTLKEFCYYGMFYQCTSLRRAPDLPATTIGDAYRCYEYMFSGCTRLSYVKALFGVTPSADYTKDWLLGVSPTGTFVKRETSWDPDSVRGSSGVPVGWSVQVV